MSGMFEADMNPTPTTFTCDVCGQEGLEEDAMRSHVLIEHVEGQVSCPFCDLEGISVDEMSIHVNRQHLDVLSPTEDDDIAAGDGHNDGNVSSATGNGEQNNRMLDTRMVLPDAESSVEHVQELINGDLAHKELDEEKGDMDTSNVQNGEMQCQSAAGTSGLKCQSNYSCPLCGWETTSAESISVHVNVTHLDGVTPTKKPQTENESSRERHPESSSLTALDPELLDCPLCDWTTTIVSDLEDHVNNEHQDLLTSEQDATPRSAYQCMTCEVDCPDSTTLQLHVESHFPEEQMVTDASASSEDNLLAQKLQRKEEQDAKYKEQKEFEKLQETFGMKDNGLNFKKQADRVMERDVCRGQMTLADFYMKKWQFAHATSSGVDDGQTCTKGVSQKLKQFYSQGVFGVEHSWLCSPADHYAASHGDRGWGCGYRNLQMMLSCLAHNDTYLHVLFNGLPVIPSLPKIQRLIEVAWQKGFDPAGCEQLGGKVVDTTKWIGATEIVATLSALKIKCQLLDFHHPTGPGNTHPTMLQWVKQYFQSSAQFCPPLYLQHQGHSRTIIGVEQLKSGALRLLLFDPSCGTHQMAQFVNAPITGKLMRSLRRSPDSLRAKQYQIVAVRGVLTEAEFEDSKLLRSERIP